MPKSKEGKRYSAATCSDCGGAFNMFEKGSVGAIINLGPKEGSMNNVRHINFCKKCAKKLGLNKFKEKS